jgi:hypothetical protein
VTLRASVNSAGTVVAGTSPGTQGSLQNRRHVLFGRSLAGCVATATLAVVSPPGPVPDPGPGRIVVAVEQDTVAVDTYDAAGNPTFLPFNVIVAC